MILFDVDCCPTCGEPYTCLVWSQPALVRHAGHGHTERRTSRQCAACEVVVPPTVEAVSPRET